MKGILIKLNRGYYNLEDEKGDVIGTSYQFKSSVGDATKYKLSQQNCDEIFGVVDVEELAENSYIEHHKNDLSLDELIQRSGGFIVGFKEGFNKAMGLNKDKLFTMDDMIKAIDFDSFENEHEGKFYESKEKFIQSLQQPTEIEVEIVMDRIPADLAPGGWDVFPKLDKDNCLILKRVE